MGLRLLLQSSPRPCSGCRGSRSLLARSLSLCRSSSFSSSRPLNRRKDSTRALLALSSPSAGVDALTWPLTGSSVRLEFGSLFGPTPSPRWDPLSGRLSSISLRSRPGPTLEAVSQRGRARPGIRSVSSTSANSSANFPNSSPRFSCSPIQAVRALAVSPGFASHGPPPASDTAGRSHTAASITRSCWDIRSSRPLIRLSAVASLTVLEAPQGEGDGGWEFVPVAHLLGFASL